MHHTPKAPPPWPAFATRTGALSLTQALPHRQLGTLAQDCAHLSHGRHAARWANCRPARAARCRGDGRLMHEPPGYKTPFRSRYMDGHAATVCLAVPSVPVQKVQFDSPTDTQQRFSVRKGTFPGAVSHCAWVSCQCPVRVQSICCRTCSAHRRHCTCQNRQVDWIKQCMHWVLGQRVAWLPRPATQILPPFMLSITSRRCT